MALNFVNQPDFTAASHALHAARDGLDAAGNELAKCANLPAIQGGDALLTAIQNMERRITAQIQTLFEQQQTLSEQQQTLSEQQQALSARFQNLAAHQQASDHNNIARLANGMLHASNDNLTCLRDTQNNVIEGFPTTPAMIRQLRGSQLDEILLALGLETIGTIDQKRTRLRLVVGLRTDVA